MEKNSRETEKQRNGQKVWHIKGTAKYLYFIGPTS